MNDAITPQAVATLVDEIKIEHAKLKKPKGCEPFLQRFLNASDSVRTSLVTRLTISSDDADPVDALRALINVAVVPELVDMLCQSAIGMAKERADRLIREGKAALISGDAFKKEFRAFVQKTNIPGLLASFVSAPHASEVSALLSARPIFIQQLEIIDAPEDDRVRAVSDFLRTSADKSVWAELGLVFEGSLSEWDDQLVSRHGLICGEIKDLHADKDASHRGRLAYRRCAQLQAPLDGRVVPGHFVHACFNELADELRIGWHPDYRSAFGREGG